MKKILLLSLLCLAVAQTVAFADAPASMDLNLRCGINGNLALYNQIPDNGTLPSSSDMWYFRGSTANKQVVNLGSGNYGTKAIDSSDTGYTQFSKSFASFAQYAVATRFRVDSFDTSSKENLVQISAKWDSPAIALGIRNSHLWIVQYNTDAKTVDLGAITAGQFVEAGLYVDSSSGQVGYWLNSTGGNYLTNSFTNSGAHVEFGAGTANGYGGTTTVTYDWLGVYEVVPEPGSLLAMGTGLVGLVGFAARRRRS